MIMTLLVIIAALACLFTAWRLMRIDYRQAGVWLIVCLLFTTCGFLLAGCGQEHVIVKPQTVEVAKYTRAALPEKLVRPCTYVEPDAACWRDSQREFCDGQLLEIRDGYRKALSDCNDDKSALRALGPQP